MQFPWRKEDFIVWKTVFDILNCLVDGGELFFFNASECYYISLFSSIYGMFQYTKIFYVTCRDYLRRIHADLDEPFPVFFRLCKNKINTRENTFHEERKCAVVFKGLVGNTSVDDDDRCGPFLYLPDKIWPYFGFYNEKGLRCSLIEKTFY